MPDAPLLPQPRDETAHRLEYLPARHYSREHLASAFEAQRGDGEIYSSSSIYVDYRKSLRQSRLKDPQELRQISSIEDVIRVGCLRMYDDKSALTLTFTHKGVTGAINQNRVNSAAEQHFQKVKYALDTSSPSPRKSWSPTLAAIIVTAPSASLSVLYGLLMLQYVDNAPIWLLSYLLSLPAFMSIQRFAHRKLLNWHRQWLFYDLNIPQRDSLTTGLALTSLVASILMPLIVLMIELQAN